MFSAGFFSKKYFDGSYFAPSDFTIPTDDNTKFNYVLYRRSRR